MAASMEGVRVRLCIVGTKGCTDSSSILKCWYLIDSGRIKNIRELADDILRKFDYCLKPAKGIQLKLEGYVLPVWENVHVLRDNDVIEVASILDDTELSEGFTRAAVKEGTIPDTLISHCDATSNNGDSDITDNKHKHKKHKRIKRSKRNYCDAFEIDGQVTVDQVSSDVTDFDKGSADPDGNVTSKKKKRTKKYGSAAEEKVSKLERTEIDSDVEPDSDTNGELDKRAREPEKCNAVAENSKRLSNYEISQKTKDTKRTGMKPERVDACQKDKDNISLLHVDDGKVKENKSCISVKPKGSEGTFSSKSLHHVSHPSYSSVSDNLLSERDINANLSHEVSVAGDVPMPLESNSCEGKKLSANSFDSQTEGKDKRSSSLLKSVAGECADNEINDSAITANASSSSFSSDSDSDEEVKTSGSSHLVNKRQRKKRKRTRRRLKKKEEKRLKRVTQSKSNQLVSRNNRTADTFPSMQEKMVARVSNSSSSNDQKQHRVDRKVEVQGSRGQQGDSDGSKLYGMKKSRSERSGGHVIFDSDAENDDIANERGSIFKTPNSDRHCSGVSFESCVNDTNVLSDAACKRTSNEDSIKEQYSSVGGANRVSEQALSNVDHISNPNSQKQKTIESFAGNVRNVRGYQAFNSTTDFMEDSKTASEGETTELTVENNSSPNKLKRNIVSNSDRFLEDNRNETRSSEFNQYSEISHSSPYRYEGKRSSTSSIQEEHENSSHQKHDRNKCSNPNGEDKSGHSNFLEESNHSIRLMENGATSRNGLEESESFRSTDHRINKSFNISRQNVSVSSGVHRQEKNRFSDQNLLEEAVASNHQQGERTAIQNVQGKRSKDGGFKNVQVFTRKQYKKAGTVSLNQIELMSAASNGSKILEESDDKRSEVTSVVLEKKDYTKYPLLSRSPRPGDRLAFKTMELDEHYTPGPSDYKEGLVAGYNHTSRDVCLEDIRGSTARKAPGRFDITIENDDEILTNVEPDEIKQTLKLECLVEPRLLT